MSLCGLPLGGASSVGRPGVHASLAGLGRTGKGYTFDTGASWRCDQLDLNTLLITVCIICNFRAWTARASFKVRATTATMRRGGLWRGGSKSYSTRWRQNRRLRGLHQCTLRNKTRWYRIGIFSVEKREYLFPYIARKRCVTRVFLILMNDLL